MSTYSALISWQRAQAEFLDDRYSRAHSWSFDGGLRIAASSSPLVVPLPMSDASAVDPEEAFVASISSCHMLWFLSLARKQGFVVDSYEDRAEGVMKKNGEGRIAMTLVTLNPSVTFDPNHQPQEDTFLALHASAHELCFIANSVKTEIRCQPIMKIASSTTQS